MADREDEKRRNVEDDMPRGSAEEHIRGVGDDDEDFDDTEDLEQEQEDEEEEGSF